MQAASLAAPHLAPGRFVLRALEVRGELREDSSRTSGARTINSIWDQGAARPNGRLHLATFLPRLRRDRESHGAPSAYSASQR